MSASEFDYGPLAPGVTVMGASGFGYRIDCALGQGGFGITYKAYTVTKHTDGYFDPTPVAIKEYFPAKFASRDGDGVTVLAQPGHEEEYTAGLSRFSEEMKTLAALSGCDSVVHVINTFNANGTGYLVMEYLDGMPLYRKAEELGGRIPPEELLPKLPRLLQDISVMHRSGILHRDITPDNIMWMPDGTLKLIDFGSARHMSKKQKTVMLKLGYAPLEQYMSNGKQGPWTDVYALSATVYFLLSGVNPPDPVSRLDNDPLKPLTELGVALTPEEDAAILHGMAVQTMERTQSADELLRELTATPGRTGHVNTEQPRRPSFLRRILGRLLGGRRI